MSCSDTAHDKLLDVVALPCVQCLRYCVRKLHQRIGPVNLLSPVVRQFPAFDWANQIRQSYYILYQWEDIFIMSIITSQLLEYSMYQCVSLLQVRDRFHFWKQCVTEAIRHRCLEEVQTKNSRIVQLQEPCTT